MLPGLNGLRLTYQGELLEFMPINRNLVKPSEFRLTMRRLWCSEINKESMDAELFTYKGKPIQKADTKAWRQALARAGIKNFRWHDLRHTWASWHVQNGTPLHILQELGGWSEIGMVQRYAHI
jgi:integrase